MKHHSLLALGICFILAGCSHTKPGDAKSGAVNKSGPVVPTSAPSNAVVGKVARVNTELRFVVVDFSLKPLPPIGNKMNIYRNGQKVGELKIAGPSDGGNIAADLILGQTQPGDTVRAD